MTEHQKENIPVNGNEVSFDHDEYQYLKSIKNIIENGLFYHLFSIICFEYIIEFSNS